MAKDIYHQIVKQALIKDGWTITQDPYLVARINKKPYEVDLGAEKFIAAMKGSDKIAIEVKSFINSSITYDFHTAFGQYNVYRFFMEHQESDRKLFLAVPEEAYNNFFTDSDIESICIHFKVEIIVFNINKIEIVSWIKR